MPYSVNENKPWIQRVIKEISPSTVLDVGAGSGVYADIIRQNTDYKINIVAIEVWEPYIKQFNLEKKYDEIINKDVREIEDFNYDLVIFGDILEHMSEEDAIKLWDKVSKQSKFAIISIPTIHFPQGEISGNPYEVHIEEDWSYEKVLKTFHSIVESQNFRITGAFLARFNNEAI
jgi:phospholipid N-methyltransferase